MSNLMTGVLVAVVAGIFGLGGTVVGARSNHRRWLRQQRLDAYAHLLAKASESHEGIVRRIKRLQAGLAADEEDSQLQAILDQINEQTTALPYALGQAVARVRLLGPRSIDAMAAQFMNVGFARYEEPDPSVKELQRVEGAFIEAARRRGGLDSER